MLPGKEEHVRGVVVRHLMWLVLLLLRLLGQGDISQLKIGDNVDFYGAPDTKSESGWRGPCELVNFLPSWGPKMKINDVIFSNKEKKSQNYRFLLNALDYQGKKQKHQDKNFASRLFNFYTTWPARPNSHKIAVNFKL